MGVNFTAEEVFAMAKKLEARGRQFYQLAAMNAPDPTSAQVYTDLMNMETDHEQVFDALMTANFGDDFQDDARWQAISSAVLWNIDSDLVARFKGKQDPQTILQEAMGFEKDTIVFLLTLRDMIPRPSERRKIDQIIKEELGHVLLLGSQMAQAKVVQQRESSSWGTSIGPRPS